MRHTSEEGARHFEASGSLPAESAEIERRRFFEQDEEDSGDAAVDVVAGIPFDLPEFAAGFRHDAPEAGFLESSPEASATPKKAGFFGTLQALFR